MSVLSQPRAKTRLDELGSLSRGRSRHRPRNDASLYGGPYPFFQTGDIKAANLYLSQHSQTYSEAGLAQSKIWEAGTLCITIAANIAETAILGVSGCFPDSVVGFVPDPEKADVRFIKYYIDTIKLRMQNISHGATQDNLSVDKLLSFDFDVPDLPTQRRIAGILSAYDDLIENNLRRIRILEEMAQSLYREWFVHFRYPRDPSEASAKAGGHESAPLVDSPLGPIPDGWEVKPLFDLATVKYGKMLPKKDLVENGDYPVYGAAKIIGRHTSYTRSERTIICGCRGSVGEMQITLPRCYVTNNSFTFDPTRPELFFWLFHTLSARGLRDVTGGAAQPQITLDGISQVYLAIPSAEILEDFERRARSLAELKWNLADRNETLRQTRDLLLPKLLNPSDA